MMRTLTGLEKIFIGFQLNIEAIYLNRNDLTGMIPIRIGLLEELGETYYGKNQVHCSLVIEIRLSHMLFLSFYP